MSRAALAVAVVAALGLASPAAAEDGRAGFGSLEFQMGQYRPNIDSEFVLPAGMVGPWQESFGTSRRWMFKLHAGKALVSGYGTLEVGAGVGYLAASGRGRFADGAVSQEQTGFTLVPLTVDLTYRADLVWERLGIPLVPYGRVALLRDQWWATGAGGKTSKSGATNGWGWGGGLALVLDFIDPVLAREFERDSGITHAMLTAEVGTNHLNDFGSRRSWDLSNDKMSLNFGFLFAF
jgi:hypothetical protein